MCCVKSNVVSFKKDLRLLFYNYLNLIALQVTRAVIPIELKKKIKLITPLLKLITKSLENFKIELSWYTLVVQKGLLRARDCPYKCIIILVFFKACSSLNINKRILSICNSSTRSFSKSFFFAKCSCIRIFIQQWIIYLRDSLFCIVVWNMPNPWTASWPDPTPPNQQTHCRFHQKSSIQSSGSIYINNELIYNVHVYIKVFSWKN